MLTLLRGGRVVDRILRLVGAARAKVLLGIEPDAHLSSGLALLGDPGWQRSSSAAELAAWLGLLERELAEGALGIGVLMGYAPRTDPGEFLAVAWLAAAANVPTYTHVRELVEADPSTPIDGSDEIVIAPRPVRRCITAT